MANTPSCPLPRPAAPAEVRAVGDGTIVLSAAAGPGEVVLEVADEGTGFAPDLEGRASGATVRVRLPAASGESKPAAVASPPQSTDTGDERQ